MEKREELLEIASAASSDKFLTFVNEHKKNLADFFDGLSKKQIETLWNGINQMCAATLLTLNLAQDEQQLEGEMQSVLDTMDCFVLMAHTTINQPSPHIPAQLLSTAYILHELLLHMPEKASRLKNSTAVLFEEWWKLGLEGQNDLVTNTLIYLLQRSLSEKKGMHLVKRIWALHAGLELVDMSNESSALFVELLEQCIVNANYLNCDSGIKFLGFILTLDASLTEKLHKAIKSQIPTSPSSWLEKYGEIYFRAWSSGSEVTDKLEKSCIQDLMYHAVHAQKSLSSNIRKVLSYIHQQKKKNGVDVMLLTLYEPFLWRSLKVANPEVRGNAAWLLMDVFPLQNPDQNMEETDGLLQKQFDLLLTLLEDPVPFVRSQSALGVFKIMCVYWELMPTVTIKNIVTMVIQDLAFDSSSSDVRESVIKGLTILVDNHLCHLMLKPILPQLCNHIHDSSEKVRVAMVNLLLKVKAVRTIKFWDIVPVEHLLARLELDGLPVVRRLMALLFPSFLPLDKAEEEQIPRCKALVQSNPGAARVFFRHAHYFMDVKQTADYMVTLCRQILECIRDEKRKQNDSANSTSATDDEEEEDFELTVRNTTVMKGFIEIIVILWNSIVPQLQKSKYKKIEQDLQQKFCLAVPEMLKMFDDPEIATALVLLAGHLPSSSVPILSRSCLSKLKKISVEGEEYHYGCLLEAKCKWNKVEDLFEVLEEWITAGFNTIDKEKPSKHGKSRKSVTFVEEQNKDGPALALKYLSYLVKHPVCRAAIMTNHIKELTQIRDCLQKVMNCIEKVVNGGSSNMEGMSDDLLTQYLTFYCRLIILLHNEETPENDCTMLLGNILEWASEVMLPCMCCQDVGADNSLNSSRKRPMINAAHVKQDLCTRICKSLLMVCSNCLLIGYGSEEFALYAANFCTKCLQADESLQTLAEVSTCLYNITEFVLSDDREEDGNSVIPQLLGTVLDSVQSYSKTHKEQSDKILSSVKNQVSETVIAVNRGGCPGLQQTFMATVVTAVMDEMMERSLKQKLEECGDNFSNLPPVSSLLTDVASKKASVFREYVEDIGYRINSCPTPDIHSLHGAVHLITTIAKCKPKSSGLKDCWVAIDTHFGKLEPVPEDDSEKRNTYQLLKEKKEECQKLLNLAS